MGPSQLVLDCGHGIRLPLLLRLRLPPHHQPQHRTHLLDQPEKKWSRPHRHFLPEGTSSQLPLLRFLNNPSSLCIRKRRRSVQFNYHLIQGREGCHRRVSLSTGTFYLGLCLLRYDLIFPSSSGKSNCPFAYSSSSCFCAFGAPGIRRPSLV